MNAFVKKEIRLLLPGFLAVFCWKRCSRGFGRGRTRLLASCRLFFFLGIIILAVDSFGREFSSGTFQLLLSQPVERKQIWRTKIIDFSVWR